MLDVPVHVSMYKVPTSYGKYIYSTCSADHSRVNRAILLVGGPSSNELCLTGFVFTWYAAVFYCINATSCLTFHTAPVYKSWLNHVDK